ncbi:MAG: type II secretion system F family protein [Rhizobiaceae bacterium]|nr:type II secretion system F family protein [Rhizobiaceae bacterium]MCO5072045.1 type II secretion system F family protein [Rhizobiaceae bacterium]
MFGLNLTILLVVALAGLSAGSLAYAFLFNRVADEAKAGRRLEVIKRSDVERDRLRSAKDKTSEIARRRKNIADSLKELDSKEKDRQRNVNKAPLKTQIKQAGISMSIERFYILSAICGLAFGFAAFVGGLPIYVVPAAALVGSVGLPRWIVSFLRKLRIKKFLAEFPNALDIIVRAVKSGLPLNDGIRMIAHEAKEPVKSEFRRVVEAQQLGLSIPEASMRMVETMPCPEAGFFGIVIQIQSQAGGNLSEALGNLSRVLRDRKKMKAKVQALSMEAKASAMIIGALPFVVALLVYLSSPTYIMPLFTTSIGHIVLGVSGFWMLIGVLVMRQMINFDV